MDKWQLVVYAMFARLGIVRQQQEYIDCKTLFCKLGVIILDLISIGAFLLMCHEIVLALFSTKMGNLTTNGQWILGCVFIIVVCFSPVELAIIARRKIIQILFKKDQEAIDELTKEDGKH